MEFKLTSGISVSTNDFYMGGSYSGLIHTSIYYEELNREYFDEASYPKNWGERKVLKIEPSNRDFTIKLKEYKYCVWLNSSPMDKQFCGSELVVIWFDDPPNNRSIEEIIEKGIVGIDWNNNARDFDY